jgi:TonB family protein
MLNANVNRKPLSRWSRTFTVVALLSITLPIAGLVAQSTFVTVSGSVLDGTNRVFPNVTLVLTNTGNQAKHEVRSDSTGHFEFVGVPAGEYVLETDALGFARFRDKVTVAGRNITRNIELQVASLQETITVTDRGGRRASAGQTENPFTDQTENAQLKRQLAQDMLQLAVEKCLSNRAGPIGGAIVPPTKLMDVKPHYPENLRNANVGGVVVLDALLATDGSVKDVQGVSSPNADLQNAAEEAVRQWQFSSTLLDCVPIEVRMRVTVNFKESQP